MVLVYLVFVLNVLDRRLAAVSVSDGRLGAGSRGGRTARRGRGGGGRAVVSGRRDGRVVGGSSSALLPLLLSALLADLAELLLLGLVPLPRGNEGVDLILAFPYTVVN